MKETEILNILLKELPEQNKEYENGGLGLNRRFTVETLKSPVKLFRMLCPKKMGRLTLDGMISRLCPIGSCLGEEEGCQRVDCLDCWECYLREKYNIKEVNLREELKDYR